uniref:Uncharacterized protein n=1 Tax=Anguilla anguilla TaxID=7936 RepID=A0A0E9WG58_ANGAN
MRSAFLRSVSLRSGFPRSAARPTVNKVLCWVEHTGCILEVDTQNKKGADFTQNVSLGGSAIYNQIEINILA